MRRVVLAMVLASACARTSRPHLESIQVDAFEGGDVVEMSSAQLRERLVDQFNQAKFVIGGQGSRTPEGVTAWRVKLAAGLGEPDPESRTVDVQVVLNLAARGEPEGFAVRAHQQRSLNSNDLTVIQQLVLDALDQALAHAVGEAKGLIEFAPMKDEALAARLTQGDEAGRAAVVRLLARRRNQAALPALLGRLGSPDLQEVRGAIGLLVELGSAEAVNPMIEAAGARGPVVAREVVYAVGAIGGDDAEAYLDLVASGEDDPVLRAAAEQALEELRTRKQKKGASP
jgi:hypothetical protein